MMTLLTDDIIIKMEKIFGDTKFKSCWK